MVGSADSQLGEAKPPDADSIWATDGVPLTPGEEMRTAVILGGTAGADAEMLAIPGGQRVRVLGTKKDPTHSQDRHVGHSKA